MKQLILILSAMVVLLPSCIKDKYNTEPDFNTERLVTEFAEGREEITVLGLDAAPVTQTIDLAGIRAVSRSQFTGSYTVKLVPNNTLVADYNTNNGTSYTPAPANAIQLQTLTYTISPDQREVKIKATVNTTNLLSGEYAIGLSIAEVSNGEISGVAKNLLVAVTVKNQYDGVYRVYGYFSHPNPANTGAFDESGIEFITSGSSSVDMFHPPSGGGQPFIGGFFAVYPSISVDPSTNAVTVTVPGQSAAVHPNGAQSRYDPSTRTFYIYYGYNSAAPRLAYDTCVYLGPR
jgi:Domain of unknown function (DUF1735)